MRTLVVTHYFPPEIGAPQARLSELARYWAEAGDDVVVLTGLPNHPTGVIPPAYRGVRRRVEQGEGFRVVRTWLYATPNEGIAKKTLGHLSFMASSALLGRRATGPADVVMVSSPTFFAIFSGWYLARRKRARFVIEVRDLWPAIFVELGVLTNPLAIRVLEAIELAAYGAADAVVVVSEGFRDNLIDRGVPAEKVFTIRNGVDLDRFTPAPPGADVHPARTALGARDDETLVLYIGAHGISHGLTAIADAAAALRDDAIHVAFVGEGAAKAALRDRVAELGLTNVTLLPGVPRDEVPALLDAADICLVPLRDVPLFSTFIPSKIFEYFGAGKAVVGAVRGEPAEILREGGAIVVEPEDVEAIAAALRALAADPERRSVMGAEGHAYVAAHFDRRMLATRYQSILRRVVATPRPRRQPSSSPRPLRGGPAPIALDLARHVVRHPENRRARGRALARVGAWQLWQRTTRRPWTTTRLLGGMKLRCYPHSSAASAVLYTSVPECEDGRLVHDVLTAGDVFIDVGANVGVYSLIAAATPGAEVHAFEPSTAAQARLRENIILNGLESRVHAHALALGDEHRDVHLTIGRDTTNVVLDRSNGADPDAAAPTEPVLQTTLDRALDPELASRVVVVKIDVEGREDRVLAGATHLLQQVRPIVIVEANDLNALRARLEPLGYRPCAYNPDTKVLTEIEWHTARHPNVLDIADLDRARQRLSPERTP